MMMKNYNLRIHADIKKGVNNFLSIYRNPQLEDIYSLFKGDKLSGYLLERHILR